MDLPKGGEEVTVFRTEEVKVKKGHSNWKRAHLEGTENSALTVPPADICSIRVKSAATVPLQADCVERTVRSH